MHHRSKLLLAALTTALLLAGAVATANATRFEMSNQQIRIVWRELSYVGGSQTIICPVTYEGSFHSRTFSKVSGQLIGYINRAVISQSECRGGTEYYLNGEQGMPNTLPWHIRYSRFEGPLPRITGVALDIVGLSWLVEVAAFGGSCLFRSTERAPLLGIMNLNAESRVSGFRQSESIAIPKAGGGILCPASIEFPSGAGAMTSQEGRDLFVRLVR